MNLDRATQVAYLLLRVVAGLLIMQAGGLILFAWFGGDPTSPDGRTPLMSQAGIGGIIQFFGGLLLMLGLFTRPAAFLLSGTMAVAYWQFHAIPQGGWPIENFGQPAVLLCFIFLYQAARGGGDWSLDVLVPWQRLWVWRRTAERAA